VTGSEVVGEFFPKVEKSYLRLQTEGQHFVAE